MTENETGQEQPTGAERLAAAEDERQRTQAQGEQDRLAAEQETAEDRAEQARVQGEIDPASPEGQQAAMRRGDPVQLTGDEMLGGRRLGTNTTHNESMVVPVAPQSGPQGHNFVTGAAGEPIPAEDGVVPERPSVGAADFSLEEAHQAPEVARAPYEQGEAERIEQADREYAERSQPDPENQTGPPARSAAKAEWVDHAVSRGADRDEAEGKTKDDLIAEHGEDVERHGTEGPGVSQ